MSEDDWLETPDGEQWLREAATAASALARDMRNVACNLRAVASHLTDMAFDHGAVTPDGASHRLTAELLDRVSRAPT